MFFFFCYPCESDFHKLRAENNHQAAVCHICWTCGLFMIVFEFFLGRCAFLVCGCNSAILHTHGVKYMEAISESGDRLDCSFNDSCATEHVGARCSQVGKTFRSSRRCMFSSK